MEKAVQQVKAAQEKFSTFNQKQIDAIVKHIAETAFAQAETLARMAVEETGMGVVEHKKIKNELGSMGVYESIKDEKTVGVIHKDHRLKMTEVAYPFGVIAAICPTTNPTSTAIFKTLIALKAQNGIVVSPHPTAKRCTVEALKICAQAAVEAGAPDGLIGWITDPSMEATTRLMQHPDVELILATGGSGLVKAAYSSGKPAYGVGPGNGPVYIEKSANVKKAAQLIVDSKTFDNGTLCSTEQSIVVHRNIKEMTMRELRNNGAYFLNEEEKMKLGNVIAPTEGQLNAKIVGRSAETIAEMAGIEVPVGTRVLIAEEDRIGKDVPFSLEKLAPIFPLYTADSDEEALRICEGLLNFIGRGHSCSIHTTDEEAAQRYGLAMPVSRVMVNTMASIGAAGATTGLMPSLTLGCGSYGGNISSDNITARHLFNTKRIASGIKEVTLPKPSPRRYEPVEKLVQQGVEPDIEAIIDQVMREVQGNCKSMDLEDVSTTVRQIVQRQQMSKTIRRNSNGRD
ncbi:aldehyde dehydrogenase family protein [Bacillus sp. OxB-1]|uniref:aldehyde dehydrogenase family protein n=1 Tax=Bacillus sp. (strain OxB-1) TaxID=98228 RepID=UPI000695B932|nr:aldehyde dehydrogenase family protein [Bacillus sp. OxB-1]